MAGRHRLEPPRRVRVRRGRMAAASAAAAITAIALLCGMGVVPLPGSATAGDRSGADAGAAQQPTTQRPTTQRAEPQAVGRTAPTDSQPAEPAPPQQQPATQPVESEPSQQPAASPTAVPAGSGQGRRIVFSIPQQRVWLIDGRGRTVSTYLVSGSVTDNLKPGSYSVYSRSRWANGIQDSGVMEYFVRFTQGRNAAIGFHNIPTKNGVPLQSVRQLGTPQSHGCIRQRMKDAIRLWDFAPLGTRVVVV